MHKAKISQSDHICDKCSASFFTLDGLKTHFQRQHGIYCETCPLDAAVQKITSVFKQKK